MSHRKKSVLLFAISIALLLCGCNGMYLTGPAHPYEWATADDVATSSTASTPVSGDDVTSCKMQTKSRKYHIEQKIFPTVVCVDMKTLAAIENRYYYTDTNDQQRKMDRDRWVQIMMRDIDVLWWGYKNGFLSNDDSTKVASDTIVTGTAAASAGVTAAGGKTALAVIAATLNGFNSSFDKDVLANQMAPMLFASIESQRETIETQIIKGLGKDVGTYSLAIAARDVMRYANAGSLSNALASLSGKAGADMNSANQERDNASEQSESGVLDAPTSITASASNNEVSLDFTPPTEAGGSPILGYKVIVQPTTGSPVTLFLPAVDGKKVVVKPLDPGSYTFALSAIAQSGFGKLSEYTKEININGKGQ